MNSIDDKSIEYKTKEEKIEERNNIVRNNLVLAEKLANKKYITVHKSVQYGELLSAAYEGLIDAASKFDTTKVNQQAKEPFKCYATARIKGSINDYLRTCSWGTRGNPKYVHSLETMTSTNDWSDSSYGEVPSLRETLRSNEIEAADKLNSRELFMKVIRGLPKREKEVFRLRFIEDLTMKETADILEISESRVSQILSKNVEYLKSIWDEKKDALWLETVCV